MGTTGHDKKTPEELFMSIKEAVDGIVGQLGELKAQNSELADKLAEMARSASEFQSGAAKKLLDTAASSLAAQIATRAKLLQTSKIISSETTAKRMSLFWGLAGKLLLVGGIVLTVLAVINWGAWGLFVAPVFASAVWGCITAQSHAEDSWRTYSEDIRKAIAHH